MRLIYMSSDNRLHIISEVLLDKSLGYLVSEFGSNIVLWRE